MWVKSAGWAPDGNPPPPPPSSFTSPALRELFGRRWNAVPGMRRLPSPAETRCDTTGHNNMEVTTVPLFPFYISRSLASNIWGSARSRPVETPTCLLLGMFQARRSVCVCVCVSVRLCAIPLENPQAQPPPLPGNKNPMEGCLHKGAWLENIIEYSRLEGVIKK